MPYLLGLILLHLVLHGLSLIRCHAEPLCGRDGWVAIRRLPSVIAENRATIALSILAATVVAFAAGSAFLAIVAWLVTLCPCRSRKTT
jgi:hypothetical protein